MKKLSLVALILIGSVSSVSAQTSWWRTYGGSTYDEGYSVQQTSDGGYIVAGLTGSFDAVDIYLVKTNASGDTLWTRTYGGTDYDMGRSVQQTTDGGYIVAGGYSLDAGFCDVYLIKTNSSGDTLWTRTYGGRGDDWGESVQQTTDGGYIVAGYVTTFDPGSQDVYLIKTDASGDTLWTRTFGGTVDDWGKSVQQTSDDGYIVAGGTYSIGAGYCDIYLIKTNSSGDTLWTKTYGGTEYEYGLSVRQTSDSGYIIAGYTEGAGGADVCLIKTDASGDTLWTRTYGGTYYEEGHSVQQTQDGGYIIAGFTFSFGDTADCDVYLIKTSAQGDTLWTRTFGGTVRDEGYSVRQTSDGGYVIAGRTWSFGAGWYDVYLIKTDSLGNVGVAEENPEPRAIGRKLAASFARSLPQDATAFDAMGRRVLNPEPGVYFLREAQAQAQAQAIRKVLLVR